jgi:hypothetical protein
VVDDNKVELGSIGTESRQRFFGPRALHDFAGDVASFESPAESLYVELFVFNQKDA